MPSPDFRPYVDLTLYDLDPQALYLDALERVRQTLPEWEPREGQIELVLLQALAFEVAETVGSINRLPNSMIEGLLRLFGIERQSGSYPTATVLITAIDGDITRTVPFGTRMFYSADSTSLLVFELDDDVDLDTLDLDGKATGTGNITAVSASEAYAGLAEGTALTLLTPTAFIASIELASSIATGSVTETDTDYFNRGMLRLNRLTEALTRPEHFTNYVLENFPAVKSAHTYDQLDENQDVTLGHVAIFVLGPEGAEIDAGTQTVIQEDVTDMAQANLEVHVLTPTIVPVIVIATVAISAGYSSAAVQAACEAAVESFLDPNIMPFLDRVRLFEIIAVLSNVAGVEYVSAATLDTTGAGSLDAGDVISSDPATVFHVKNIAGSIYEDGSVTINTTPA